MTIRYGEVFTSNNIITNNKKIKIAIKMFTFKFHLMKFKCGVFKYGVFIQFPIPPQKILSKKMSFFSLIESAMLLLF